MTTVQKDNETEVVANAQYDLFGRTTSVTEDGKTSAYTYDNMGNVLTVTNEDGVTTYAYDASGNPLNYMGHNLSWTMGRQLASFDGIAYTYNETGIRTSKTSNGATTRFYLNGTDIIEQTDGTTKNFHLLDNYFDLLFPQRSQKHN